MGGQAHHGLTGSVGGEHEAQRMVISILILALAIAFLAYGAFRMSDVTARLTASVANLTNVSASAVALIGGLAQAIRDNQNDPTALAALADQIDNDSAGLASAITANTPVATAPGVQPDPTVPAPAGTSDAPSTTDTPTGSDGTDTISGDTGTDTVNAGNGSDTLDGTGEA